MPRIPDTSGPQGTFDKLPEDMKLPTVESFKLPPTCPKSHPADPESGINTIMKIGGIDTLPAKEAMKLFILTISEVIRRQRENQQ